MEDTKISLHSNVLLRVYNQKTNKITEYRFHNRITKNTLLGIAKFIFGDFNESNIYQSDLYIPKYLALGGYSTSSGDIKYPQDPTSVNATSLTNELTNNTAYIPSTPRIEISSRSITNEISNDYIKLTYKMFIPNTALINTVINEAGLFATRNGDTCCARIGFAESPIEKDNKTTIDIIWDITMKSISSNV